MCLKCTSQWVWQFRDFSDQIFLLDVSAESSKYKYRLIWSLIWHLFFENLNCYTSIFLWETQVTDNLENSWTRGCSIRDTETHSCLTVTPLAPLLVSQFVGMDEHGRAHSSAYPHCPVPLGWRSGIMGQTFGSKNTCIRISQYQKILSWLSLVSTDHRTVFTFSSADIQSFTLLNLSLSKMQSSSTSVKDFHMENFWCMHYAIHVPQIQLLDVSGLLCIHLESAWARLVLTCSNQDTRHPEKYPKFSSYIQTRPE